MVLFLFINEYLTNKLSEGHDDSHPNAGGGNVEDDSGGLNLEKKIKKLKGSYKENSPTLRFSPGVKATKKAICARRTPATNRCITSDIAASMGIFDLCLVKPGKPPLSSSCDANLASQAPRVG